MPMVVPGIDESIFKKLSKRLQKQLKTTHPQLQLGTLQEAMAKALGHASLHDARQHWSRSTGALVEKLQPPAQDSIQPPPVSPSGDLSPSAENAWLSQGRQAFKEWALKTDPVAWKAAKALERGEPLVETLGEDERFWRSANGKLLLQRMAAHGWWNGALEVWQGLPGLHVSDSLLPKVAFWAHRCAPSSSVDWAGLVSRVVADEGVVVERLRRHFIQLPCDGIPSSEGISSPWSVYPAGLLQALLVQQRTSQNRSWWAVVALEEDPALLLEKAPAKELWDLRNDLARRGLWKALDRLVKDIPIGLKDWIGLCASAGDKSGRASPEAVEHLQAWLLDRVAVSAAPWSQDGFGVAAAQGQPPGFWEMDLRHLPDGLGARVWQALVKVGGGWGPRSPSFALSNEKALLVACHKLMGEEGSVLEDFLRGVHQDTRQETWPRFLTNIMTSVAWESHGGGLDSTKPEDLACGRLLDKLAYMGGSWTDTSSYTHSQEKHSPQSRLYRRWSVWHLENRMWPGNDINAACVGFKGHLFSIPQMALLKGHLCGAEQILKQKEKGVRFALAEEQKEIALQVYLKSCHAWFEEEDEDDEGAAWDVFNAERGLRLTEQWLRESGVWENKDMMRKAYGFLLYPELLERWRHWCGELPTTADMACWFEQAGLGPGWGQAIAKNELERFTGPWDLTPSNAQVYRVRELTRVALKWKVNIVTPIWDETTVLHHAAALKTSTEKQEMVVLDILEELVAAGADPLAKDAKGNTPRDWVPENASVRWAFLTEAMLKNHQASSFPSL